MLRHEKRNISRKGGWGSLRYDVCPNCLKQAARLKLGEQKSTIPPLHLVNAKFRCFFGSSSGLEDDGTDLDHVITYLSLQFLDVSLSHLAVLTVVEKEKKTVLYPRATLVYLLLPDE